MITWENKKRLFVAFFVSLFAFLNLFNPISTPVYAVQETGGVNLDENTGETDNTNLDNPVSPENSTKSEEENTCLDESGAIGWLICPTTGAIAKAIDAIYSMIEDFLVIDPISSDSSSTIHIVWEYIRNITNIVFIIFLLVVVYSQLTGIGLNNYGIKSVLPRIIVTILLVNLSFFICQIIVDASNIVGVGLRDFLVSVQESATSAGASVSANIGWTELVATLTGGGLAVAGGVALTGGLAGAFWAVIPIILGAFVSIAIGLITIAMRQAIISLLVMVSPLAFVCNLFPNTEKWFGKWKSIMSSMLIFFPTFSLLFGASELAGWAIISSSTNIFGIILGLAVQVYPLFTCWSLMKMSGTVLGTINQKLHGLATRPLGAFSRYSAEQSAIKRAEYTRNQLRRPFNPLSGGSWHAKFAQSSVDRKNRLSTAEKDIANITMTDLNARKGGRRIIGYNDAGMPIYSSHYSPTSEMRREFSSRVTGLNTQAAADELENSMDQISTYMSSNGIKDDYLSTLAKAQAGNFIEYKTQQVAKKINARSDQRFYSERVKEASLRNTDGSLKNPALYHQLIERGAGADYHINSSLSGEARAKAEELSQAAAVTVISDAYDALEADRKITTAKYTTYFNKQVTKEVLNQYDNMLKRKDIDGIVAAQNILAMRGDYDKISEYLEKYMDEENYVELGTDFANVLALNLLGMKGLDPKLARLGKHINVETWHYTNWSEESGEEQRSSFVTMKEFHTGKDSKGIKTKYYAPTLMQGTPLKDIDRTFYADLSQDLEKYYTAENFGSEAAAQEAKRALISSMMPQIISAVPTYPAGSEALGNTMNFLTGLKYDTVRDEWYPEWLKRDEAGNWIMKKPGISETAEEAAERTRLTTTYLRGMTPSDVISMKTDAFNSAMLRFRLNHGYDMNKPDSDPENQAAIEAAIADFREIYTKNHVIERLRAADPSVLAPMKDSVRRALGL